MERFERMLAVSAPADEVYRYAMTVENLPLWVPAVITAESDEGGGVRLRGRFAGSDWTATARLEADPEAHLVRWRTEGAHGSLAGELEVRPGDTTDVLSELTLRLELPPGTVQRGRASEAPTVREDEVEDALGMALVALRDAVERRERPV